jgi:tRNA A-37 threonylcarbamoyl transferase component Bud32
MMRTCPHCGTLNRANATYCNQCGALLAGSASPAGVANSAASAVGQRANDPGATLVTVTNPDDPGATNVNIPTNASGAHTTPHISPRTGLLPPQTLLAERYLILEKLGQGGMAAVYKAKDEAKRGEPLRAIKEMSQAALKESEREQAIENFQAEAEMLKALDHPNLPKFYEQFQEEDRYYLVMEYIEGETLEDRLERVGKGLPERDVMDWAEQLCSVLTYLHERRPPIIFRDLKPGNIMVTKQNQVKLIDFGIARIFRRDKTHDTQVLGTPGYAPPEQYGKGQTDPRSDVYALGVTLHQLLTNYDPSSTPFSLPPLHTLNPDVSPHVQAAIEQATRLKREERFESISDFHSALFAPGAFVFRGGQRAATVAELVALSRQLPQEAEEYLYAGRFEAWLRTIGERKLAKVARSVVASKSNHAQGLDEFLRQLDPAGSAATTTSATPPRASTLAGTGLQLQPGALDIGPLVPGQAGIASFTVSGAGGLSISGEVKPLDSWLHVSPARFNGPSTLIEVRADTSGFAAAQKHQGGIQISGAGQHLIMPVSVAVLGNQATGVLTAQQLRNRNRILKHSWPPLRQPELVQQAVSAVMSFGLSLAAILAVQQAIGFHALTTLLSGPFFPLLLVGWSLLATIGAMIGRWGDSLERRALTSAVCSLTSLGLVALLWANLLQPQIFHGVAHPEALLVTSIAVEAITAALGAAPRISGYVLRILGAIARRATILVFIGMLFLGGYVGYLLTSGFPAPLRFFQPIVIVVGIILGTTLAVRLNRYIRRFQRRQTTKP